MFPTTAARYHPFPVLKFLFFALPLLVMTMGLWAFALDTFAAELAARVGIEGLNLSRISTGTLLAGWLMEAIGLTGLFLLLHRRRSQRWFHGLATGWIAWIFRGPLLVVAIAAASRLDPAQWWRLALGWLPLYTLCGLLLAALAGMLRDDSTSD